MKRTNYWPTVIINTPLEMYDLWGAHREILLERANVPSFIVLSIPPPPYLLSMHLRCRLSMVRPIENDEMQGVCCIVRRVVCMALVKFQSTGHCKNLKDSLASTGVTAVLAQTISARHPLHCTTMCTLSFVLLCISLYGHFCSNLAGHL